MTTPHALPSGTLFLRLSHIVIGEPFYHGTHVTYRYRQTYRGNNMGAQQSSAGGAHGPGANAAKTDYYNLLGVDPLVDDEE